MINKNCYKSFLFTIIMKNLMNMNFFCHLKPLFLKKTFLSVFIVQNKFKILSYATELGFFMNFLKR